MQKTKQRYRRSKLDEHAHLVGRIPDREVASMAGMTPDGVRMYRQRHKIPAYSSFKRSLKEPVRAPVRVPARPRMVAGELQAFRVEVRGAAEVQVVLAPDVVAAARAAVETSVGEVTCIERMGAVLAA